MSIFAAFVLTISAGFLCLRAIDAPIGASLKKCDWAALGVFLTSLVICLITNP